MATSWKAERIHPSDDLETEKLKQRYTDPDKESTRPIQTRLAEQDALAEEARVAQESIVKLRKQLSAETGSGVNIERDSPPTGGPNVLQLAAAERLAKRAIDAREEKAEKKFNKMLRGEAHEDTAETLPPESVAIIAGLEFYVGNESEPNGNFIPATEVDKMDLILESCGYEPLQITPKTFIDPATGRQMQQLESRKNHDKINESEVVYMVDRFLPPVDFADLEHKLLSSAREIVSKARNLGVGKSADVSNWHDSILALQYYEAQWRKSMERASQGGLMTRLQTAVKDVASRVGDKIGISKIKKQRKLQRLENKVWLGRKGDYENK